MASDDEEPFAKRQTYQIPASEDDGEDRPVWEAVECVLPNCTKGNFKKAQVWSSEGEEECVNQFLRHETNSRLHWHMSEDEIFPYIEKLVIVEKADTFKDREAYRKQMLASAPPEVPSTQCWKAHKTTPVGAPPCRCAARPSHSQQRGGRAARDSK